MLSKKMLAGIARQRKSGLGVLLAMAVLLSVAGLAQAAVPPVSGKVQYDLQNQPLDEFLSKFFASQGVGVVIDNAVKSRNGTLSGVLEGDARNVLDTVMRSNGLVAYFDGATVFIYSAAQRETRFISLPPEKSDAFVRAVASMNIRDENNSVSTEAGTGMIKVVGTPRFITQVQRLANSVATSVANASPTPTVFKFFPLKYALASDTTMSIGSQQVTVPGVATLLRQLVGVASVGNFGSEVRMQPRSQSGLRGSGLASVGGPPVVPPAGFANDSAGGWETQQPQTSNVSSQPVPQESLVRIVADPYRNAVIVRDTPERIPMYAQLIQNLDVKSPMVEIEATIIDVDKEKMKEFGIDWYFQNSSNHGGIGFNSHIDQNGNNDLIDALAVGTIDRLLQLAGFQAGAIIGDSAKFIARVNAMQGDGITDVITRPQVLTLDDVQAVIATTKTIYVPVSGAYSEDLYNVVAGTVLRVTPHVIDENGTPRIRLVVSIQDGNVTLSQAEYGDYGTIPLVTRSAINTQAVIHSGQSLLLGGLISDQKASRESKVPILGDIPIIRNLFRHMEEERSHRERLFLITPRLVSAQQITQQRVRSATNVSVEEIQNNQRIRKRQGKDWMVDPEQDPLPPQGPPPPPPELQALEAERQEATTSSQPAKASSAATSD